ncbi:MAG: PDDEXK nuclease domain-containing protein [Candidatus Margulisiibacteriota bacterium]|jgi:predicted nuclease of restriction endonuclease-like (RecB) superfamily
MKLTTKDALFNDIKTLLTQARAHVIKAVNTTMIVTYFEIGRLIVEHEQKGKERAEYGKQVLKELSKKLTIEFGRGFSVENLDRMRFFYQVYSNSISSTPLTKSNKIITSQQIEYKFALSWSHYLKLMRMTDPTERQFYETESIQNNWSLRELERQFDSALYERIVLSRDKKGVLSDNLKKYHSPQKPEDVVKDPYVLEFLGLKEDKSYSETELEQSIIDKIEHFLLELGKGFAFIGRQQRFTFDEEHFFVDLVFYNRLLKCFVLIDLKIGKLKHQDLGQMQMYVNYYDRFVKTEEENSSIGIVLSKDKKESLVEITLPKDSNIFASQYQLYLPTKEELREQLEAIGSN